MKWFEYKQETDALHASEALKARLLAMQTRTGAADGSADTSAAAAGAGAADTAAASAAKSDGASYTAAGAYGTPGTAAAKGAAAGKKPRRAPVRLPWRRIAALAACFALGVVMTDALGWQIVPRMGAANLSTASSGAGAAEGGWGGTGAEAAEAADAAQAAQGTEDTLTQDGPAAKLSEAAVVRKIIYTARLTLETKAYDETVAALQAAAEAAGGYVESQNEDSYGESRYSTTVFRLPAAQYEAFLTASADAGSVVSRSETAQDITADYLDVDARVQALTTQRDRLLEMEQSAENLSDLLEIENQLTQVQYQLESWQAQLNYYDDQVDYCTVTVEVQEVKVYTPTDTSFAARLGNALRGAVQDFGGFFADLALWLAGRWPWVILVCAAGGIGLAVRRKKRRG